MNIFGIKALKLNSRDNNFTAFAKGGASGMIVSGLLVGTVAIVGKIIQMKDNSGKELGE